MRRHSENDHNTHRFQVKGKVLIFPVINPWVYVSIPKKYTQMTHHHADRGLVAITVFLGKSTWNTSLMPKGDGTQFIPLPAKVRKIENIQIGGNVSLFFVLRKR